ncbi:Undecaprenyl-phosphate galactose phosphotransferase WbaP [Deinococcus sp. UYEF24]
MAALAVGSVGAWLLVALLTFWLFPGWTSVHLSAARWAGLIVLHLIFLYGARQLPGWGLGIVNELRNSVQTTVLLVGCVFLLSLSRQEHLVASLPYVPIMCLAVITQLGARSFVKTLLLNTGLWGVPVVVYGAALTGTQVIRALQSEPGLGYRPLALFDDNSELHGSMVLNVPVVGNTKDWAIEAPVAIVAMPGAGQAKHSELLDGALSVYRTVIVIPNLHNVQTLWTQTRDLGGILGVQIDHTLADPFARRTKRLLSLLLVGASFPLWAPLCGLVALLIWLEDRQNPLFLQERVGRGGAVFKTWKFRTMVPNAEKVLEGHLAEDPALKDEWRLNFKLRHDPRITRIGGFLRKTSLDELPQLVNVLRGEMALVGPRPLPTYHQSLLPAHVQSLRQEVRPGMTGLWQVSGRSEVGNEGMIEFDPYYVRNWSVWLDTVILLRTFRAVLRSAGAY